jgi:phosphoribosyl 1,2-cyclic phosphodiesterase
MDINVIASGSSGNCILIDDGASQIMLDCGVPYSSLIKAGIAMSNVDGVLISHEHGDHVSLHHKFAKRMIPMYSSAGTIQFITDRTTTNFGTYFAMRHGKAYRIGGWIVTPFDVRHDAVEPFGFVCQSMTTGEKVCYFVDSAVVQWSFSGVTHWLVECNHLTEKVQEMENDYLRRRILRSHMSMENLIKFFNDIDLSEAKEIHLLHLSNDNSDEARFIEELQQETGIPVFTH